MAERTEQRTRDVDPGAGIDADATRRDDAESDVGSILGEERRSTASEASGGIGGRLRRRANSVFSVRTFAIALLLTLALSFVAGVVIPLVPNSISGLLGVFVAGFAMGATSERQRYLEVGAATVLAGALTALLSHVVLTLWGLGVPVVAFGAGSSGVAGVVGHYFGRDLRAGLTQEL